MALTNFESIKMPPRGREVVPKAIPDQKLSEKSILLENVKLHDEKIAENLLLNDREQLEGDTLGDGSA